MPGSNSAFIPTINAITTSQDLQWMVQPTVITSMSNPYTRSHPYGHHHLSNGPGLLGHNALTRPGVIRSIGDARGRRKRDEQVRVLATTTKNEWKFLAYEVNLSPLEFFESQLKYLPCSCSWPSNSLFHPLSLFALSSPRRKRRSGG